MNYFKRMLVRVWWNCRNPFVTRADHEVGDKCTSKHSKCGYLVWWDGVLCVYFVCEVSEFTINIETILIRSESFS